jgi:8-oxo-dGTP diphosphatase
METWHNVPVFGARSELAVCVIRPSAYALIDDNTGRLAVVRTAQGTYLPGGGIEAGESAEETIARELREECGLIVRPAPWPNLWAVRAVQFVYSELEKTHFEKRSVFLEAAVAGHTVPGLEIDHELVWLPSELAIEQLSHESHGWAVECWISRTRA